MANLSNVPYANVLGKTYPAPEGIKIFTAGEDASKMLAFWSVKQSTKSVVLRVGDSLAKFTLHSCPHCEQALSAQATRMNQKEREMIASLMAMLKQADATQAPSKAPAKKAKQAAQAPKVAAPAPEPEEELSEEQMAELERLTSPGGGS